MFRKSSKSAQFDLFGSVPSLLPEGATHKYHDSGYWHNQFRKEVLDFIDETHYKVLFNDTMGAPNASIRLLVGMMILKEAFGLSDSQLFEQCQFNLLTRSALGLVNMNDPLPAESTYYLLRKRIYEYHRDTGKDLLGQTFTHIAREQIKQFDVNGRKIRMDSKLIGSNIAYFSRYEIIHHTLNRFYKTLGDLGKARLDPSEKQQLDDLAQEEPNKTVYRSTKEEIASGSVQSPHDPDSAFRHKGDQNFGTTKNHEKQTHRRNPKGKQCGSHYFSIRLSIKKQQNKIPRLVQTTSLGLLQVSLGKSCQNCEFYKTNMSKNN